LQSARYAPSAWRLFVFLRSLSFEIAFVLVRLDHVASGIAKADHSIMRAAAVFGVVDCVADRVRFVIPQPPEWQRIGYQIDAGINVFLTLFRPDLINAIAQ
jgi:hypothetical protein